MQLASNLRDLVQWSIESLSIADHKCDVIFEHGSILVLIPLGLILHVFDGDRLNDDVAIVRRIRPRRLVVEQV